MKFTGIWQGKAQKLRGNGELEYRLLVDEGGQLYVQITGNSEGGTFSGDMAFSVAEFINFVGSNRDPEEKPKGIVIENGDEKESENENDKGFLKAIVNQLLPGMLSK
ncbi:hypothetical protein D6779_02500 [Candidatus Parcubacteria bacterium]|nr:MAG: hypothetical protein D6779_02500 [Candidatus Parcubacteria bacterium]